MADPKMPLDEVRHVARLARLSLSEEELGDMQRRLEAILGHVAELDAVDVEGVEPTFHPVALEAPMRPDVLVPSLSRDEALAAAPATEEGAFSVPQVMEADS